MKVKIRNVFKIYVILIVSFVSMLILAYSIPNERISENVKESLVVLSKEGVYPRFFLNDEGSQLDNFTDTLMLNTAVYSDGDNAVKSAMKNGNAYTDNQDDNEIDELFAYLNNEKIETSEYGRYWHGYLVLLKPLLFFFNYSQIRYLNIFVLVGLFISVNILIKNRIGTKYMIAFFISVMMSMFWIIPMSLQFSSIYYIMFLSLVFLLKNYDWLKEKKLIPYLFFVVGACTSFLDLLTAPLITLGILLVTYLLFEDEENSIIYKVKEIICDSIMWTMGYGLTWASKWILGSLILGKNILSEAINQAAYRTSSVYNGQNISLLEVIKKNMVLYFNETSIKILLLIGIVLIIMLLFKRIRFKYIINKIPVLLLAAYPIIWFIVLSNHSDIHYWFTYRSLMISLYSIISLLLCFIDFNKIES
ncbi:hypothetical protein [Clostridium sp.]|uniref:hypothetical protein n=1 Tax=Clostridium sp. TaxID=1506 RepID=UPI002902DADA|nr:hypothetical protein [Clostridium sp.]MDU1032943.1 hypothetical protein [Clostridium sp.]MDU4725626.1 hypothetical protein [Clostridium sp.]